MFKKNVNQYNQRFHWTHFGNIGKISNICTPKLFRVYWYSTGTIVIQ